MDHVPWSVIVGYCGIHMLKQLYSTCSTLKKMLNSPDMLILLRRTLNMERTRFPTFPDVVEECERHMLTSFSHAVLPPNKFMTLLCQAGDMEAICLSHIKDHVNVDIERAAACGHTNIVDAFVDVTPHGYKLAVHGYIRGMNNKELLKMLTYIDVVGLAYNLAETNNKEMLLILIVRGVISVADAFQCACCCRDRNMELIRYFMKMLATIGKDGSVMRKRSDCGYRTWMYDITLLRDYYPVAKKDELSQALMVAETTSLNANVAFLREHGVIIGPEWLDHVYDEGRLDLVEEILAHHNVNDEDWSTTVDIEDVDIFIKHKVRVCQIRNATHEHVNKVMEAMHVDNDQAKGIIIDCAIDNGDYTIVEKMEPLSLSVAGACMFNAVLGERRKIVLILLRNGATLSREEYEKHKDHLHGNVCKDILKLVI